MNENQRRLSRPTALATAALALLFFTLLSPSKVYADPIAITDGFYRLQSPFRTPPRFISNSHDFQGTNFRVIGGDVDGLAQPLGASCNPCSAGSTLSINGPRQIGRAFFPGFLEINGQGHIGFFQGSQVRFDTNAVTIPLDAGLELTLTTPFSMSGTVNFQSQELDAQNQPVFTFSSDIFGSGIADIFFIRNRFDQYEVSSILYTFQPQPVPEPATLFLLGTGLAGIAAKGFRRRRDQKHE